MEKTFEEKISDEIKNTKNKWNSRPGSIKMNNFDIRQIFATDHEVNLQRDKDGMPIAGTGRLITNEEKKMIFDYILENDYPLTKRGYDIVLHAYVNGEIELEKARKL